MKPILKISDLFKISWKQTRAQIWVLAGLLIGWTIITFTLSIFSTPDPSLGLSGYTLGIILMNIVFALIGCIFNLGYLKNIFQALDGDEPQFSAYGQQARKILTYFIASIIMSIIVCIGFCLLILPGLVCTSSFYSSFFWQDKRKLPGLMAPRKVQCIVRKRLYPPVIFPKHQIVLIFHKDIYFFFK